VRFDRPLLKLPIRFDADALAAEVRALPLEAWEPHPQRFPGNEAVPLVTPAGQITNDFAGPMGPTQYLEQSPYMMQAMSEIGAVWGRGRLMGLGVGAEVPPHVDANYYWRTHIRVHIPAITNPDVDFTCGGETVNMAPGECWAFDTFRPHHVHNRGSEQRIHLVFDTVGGERLWDLLDAAQNGVGDIEPLFVSPGGAQAGPLVYEQFNYPKVMSPWELRCHIEELLSLAIDAPQLPQVRQRLDRLVAGWGAAWTRFETDDAGLPLYRGLIASVRQDLETIGGHGIMMTNTRPLYQVLDKFVFDNLVASPRVEESKAKAALAEQRLSA
jgi:hypothetical protein